MRVLCLSLPEPPSSNRYWRHARGRTYLSADALAYRETVSAKYAASCTLDAVAFPDEPIVVCFTWYRGRRAGDLDNRVKQLLDALQGLAYTDDAQIVELHAYREDAPRRGRLDVTMYARGLSEGGARVASVAVARPRAA